MTGRPFGRNDWELTVIAGLTGNPLPLILYDKGGLRGNDCGV